jgi:diaminopimelate decarboxylase/aspartate kinase
MGTAAMAEKWLVLKFGGTSVAGRRQWETIASLAGARRDDGYRVLLVCSAVAGVTNQLSYLADHPNSETRLVDLLDIHCNLSHELGLDSNEWLPEAEQGIRACLERIAREPLPSATAELLAFGEWLSTRIGAGFLRQSLDVGWVDAREALEIVSEEDRSLARRWLSAACKPGPDSALAGGWAKLNSILLTQGYVARTSNGETALLGRGGSDTSAALLAGRLSADRLEIWTDVPGLFSADPHLIPQARLLREVDFEEALEMAASGARVIQSRCIRAALATGTPIMIRDVNRLDVEGTRISNRMRDVTGVKTITCQQNMSVILLQNLDARHQVGFLAGIFNIFKQRGISVDLVATSETTTTVAINREANHLDSDGLASLVEELREHCLVKLYEDCVCVNLVGRGARTALARLQHTMEIFEHQPLLMLSQSANDLCLSILVVAGDENPLLRNAHKALIPIEEDNQGGLFGDSWQEIAS